MSSAEASRLATASAIEGNDSNRGGVAPAPDVEHRDALGLPFQQADLVPGAAQQQRGPLDRRGAPGEKQRPVRLVP